MSFAFSTLDRAFARLRDRIIVAAVPAPPIRATAPVRRHLRADGTKPIEALNSAIERRSGKPHRPRLDQAVSKTPEGRHRTR